MIDRRMPMTDIRCGANGFVDESFCNPDGLDQTFAQGEIGRDRRGERAARAVSSRRFVIFAFENMQVAAE